MDDIEAKVEIFKAIISNGSMQQKENWESTSEKVWNWVRSSGNAKAPVGRPRKKTDTA